VKNETWLDGHFQESPRLIHEKSFLSLCASMQYFYL